jgi:hypothetical protein
MLSHLPEEQRNEFRAVLDIFPECFSDIPSFNGAMLPKEFDLVHIELESV